MRRILVVIALALGALAAVVLLTAGGGGDDEKQVRATLVEFTRATGQKDYATICTRFLAPHLLDQMRQIKLPCRVALARSSLGSARSPTLRIKSVKVNGTTALADVHSGAANQQPFDGTMELVKVDGLWRVLSLAEQAR